MIKKLRDKHNKAGWPLVILTGSLLYLLNLALLFDIVVAGVLGVHPGLTVSAVLGFFSKDYRICSFICKGLDKLDDDHCKNALPNWTTFAPWNRSVWRMKKRN